MNPCSSRSGHQVVELLCRILYVDSLCRMLARWNGVELRMCKTNMFFNGAGAMFRNSWRVTGGGMMIAVNVASGGLSGRGMFERTAFLAFISSAASSVTGGQY